MFLSRARRAAWQWSPTTTAHEPGRPVSVEHVARSYVPVPTNWEGFDEDEQNSDASPVARALGHAGNNANHVAGQGRLLFATSLLDADSPTATTDPLFRLCWPERNPHGVELVWTALLLPRTSAASESTWGHTGRGRRRTTRFQDTVASPADLYTDRFSEPVVVSGGFRELSAYVEGGARLVGLTVYERPAANLLNGDSDVFHPLSTASGVPIRDRPLRRIRRELETVWRHVRNVACGSVVGDATTCRITGTTFTNIFNRTSTSRTDDTPGVLIDEYLGSRARSTTVQATAAVYASITGGAQGQVKFKTSQGELTIPVPDTTPRWYYSNQHALVMLAAQTVRGADAASEKVDILAAAGTGGQSIDVFAWSIMTDPL